MTKRPTVCLNMIVKDEAHIIEETLRTIVSVIDYYIIVDTGSSDNTQNIIKTFFDKYNIKGEIINHSFLNCTCHDNSYKKYNWFHFGWNRTYALELCYGKSDYIFIMDADDLLVGNLKFPENFNKDVYNLIFGDNKISYHRPLLFKNDKKFKWQFIGGIHEYLHTSVKITNELIQGDYYIESRRLGNRSKDPLKYTKDARILEDLIKEEPNNARYVFYCANSWFDAANYESAMKYYDKRFLMDNQSEEGAFSLHRIGQCMYLLKYPHDAIIQQYLKAYNYFPQRCEPLYDIINLYISDNKFEEAYNYCKMALEIPTPSNNSLYIMKFIYLYGIKEKLALCAANLNKYSEAYYYYNEIINMEKIPKDEYEKINFNLQQVKNKLSNKNKPILCFYIGYTNDYTQDNISFVYGSELCLLKLTEYLSNYYDIYIFSKFIENPKILNNISYLPTKFYENFQNTNNIEILVISRFGQYFMEYSIKAKQVYLWLHDIYVNPQWENKLIPHNCKYLMTGFIDKIDKIITLSEWHKYYVINYYNWDPQKICVINNAISTNIDHNIKKIKNRFIWTSNPTRGLNKLVEYFHEIHQKYPDAELYIYRGLEEFSQDEKLLEEIKKYNYIYFCGKYKNADLLNEFMKAEFWLYPTDWPETYCISAVEAQMAGCVCITTKMAGLMDTVGDRGILIDKVIYSPEYKKELLESLYKIMDDPSLKDYYSQKGSMWAQQQNWKNRTTEWLQLFNYKPNKITVKLICNWTTSTNLVKEWSKMCNYTNSWNNITITDNDQADYYCIINFPNKNDYYDPARTCVFRMEEINNARSFFPENWLNICAQDFFYYYDTRNTIEWHLKLSYSELLNNNITKTKLLSSVTSSEYRLDGHRKRIEFLKYLDKIINFDLYGRTNDFKLRNYISSLSQKNDGILPYKYTLAFENSYTTGYFTEKIIDAILGECLCFYWGCPDLEKYINSKAFIRINIDNYEESLNTIVQSINNNEWEKRINIIKSEKLKILNEIQFMPVLEKIILESKETPNYSKLLNEYHENTQKHLYFHGDKYLIQIINAIISKSNNFIETGTYRAASSKYIAENYSQTKVYSCEINEDFFKKSCENISHLSNVTLYLDSSINMLYDLAKLLNNNINVFWLDAHLDTRTWLREELCIIFNNYSKYYIFIDDFQNKYSEKFTYNNINYPYNFDSIKDILPQNTHIYYPKYNVRTSLKHPLVGWILITNMDNLNLDSNLVIKESFINSPEWPYPTKLVNLDTRVDRLLNFTQKANILGINYTRYSAINGKHLTMNEEIKNIFEIQKDFVGKRHKITHNYQRGVLGCALSHINLWKELVNSSEDYYIIFEDDVTFVDNFSKKWKNTFNILKDDYKWDLIFLGFNDDDNTLYNDTLVTDNIYKFSAELRLHGSGTHAYCIHKRGAVKLLNLINKHKVQQPIDHFMIDQFDTLCAYKVYPYLVTAPIFDGNNFNVDTDIQLDNSSIFN